MTCPNPSPSSQVKPESPLVSRPAPLCPSPWLRVGFGEFLMCATSSEMYFTSFFMYAPYGCPKSTVPELRHSSASPGQPFQLHENACLGVRKKGLRAKLLCQWPKVFSLRLTSISLFFLLLPFGSSSQNAKCVVLDSF